MMAVQATITCFHTWSGLIAMFMHSHTVYKNLSVTLCTVHPPYFNVYIHSQSTLLSIRVHLLIHGVIHSANYVAAAVRCMKSCTHRSGALVHVHISHQNRGGGGKK